MKQLLLSGVILCILFACNSRKKEAKTLYSNNNQSLIQEKNVGGILLRATYMPLHWERALGRDNPDADLEMCFRLNIVPPVTNGSLQKENMVTNADTLFWLITGQDTIPSLFAQKISNGNPSTAEYLVTFKRMPFEKTAAMQLVFKDWVYTHNRMAFSFEVKNIQNIDSISSRL